MCQRKAARPTEARPGIKDAPEMVIAVSGEVGAPASKPMARIQPLGPREKAAAQVKAVATRVATVLAV